MTDQDWNEQLQILDKQAKLGQIKRTWVLRRLVKQVLDDKTRASDSVRALSLISDILQFVKQAQPAALQPIVIESSQGKKVLEFTQQESDIPA